MSEEMMYQPGAWPEDDPVPACEYCGPKCYRGAEHNARVEDNARYTDSPSASPEGAPREGIRKWKLNEYQSVYCTDEELQETLIATESTRAAAESALRTVTKERDRALEALREAYEFSSQVAAHPWIDQTRLPSWNPEKWAAILAKHPAMERTEETK